MNSAAHPKFSDTLKEALAAEGLPVPGWDKVYQPVNRHAALAAGDFELAEAISDARPDDDFWGDQSIHLPDDSAIRLEAQRLCMICAIMVGGMVLMFILGLIFFAQSLGITERLTTLLYLREVV